MSVLVDAGRMSNGSEVALVRPDASAVRVYAVPATVIARLPKVAVPATAPLVLFPLRVPATDDTRVIALTAVSTGFPAASWTWTWIAGANVCPTTRLVGPSRKTSRLAPPGRISNGGLVSPVSPAAEAASV